MNHEGCHPCWGCEYFTKAEIDAVLMWEHNEPKIKPSIPICTHSAVTLAIRKCDNYEDSELLKDLKKKGLIDEGNSEGL